MQFCRISFYLLFIQDASDAGDDALDSFSWLFLCGPSYLSADLFSNPGPCRVVVVAVLSDP